MRRRHFIRNTAMGSLALSYFGCTGSTGYQRIIDKAGNLTDHGERYLLLLGLRDAGNLPSGLQGDLEILLPYARTWAYDSTMAEKIEDPHMKEWYLNAVYHQKIREGLSPENMTEIGKESALYPLYCYYVGLAFINYTIEMSWIRKVPHMRELWYGKGRELLQFARETYPGNITIGMYFNEPIPWESPVQPHSDAPAWANIQRESMLKLQHIIHWWIDHRQLSDGTYGGGLNDDCEMWRWWKAVLIGHEDAKAVKAQHLLTEVTLSNPELALGYTSRLTDVEHSSEETSDVITPMMHLYPEDPHWADRVRKIFQLVQNQWSGKNERGFTQFKSNYISSTDMDTSPHRSVDAGYHFRLMQPLLLYWQRTGDPEMGDWILDWMKAWVDASLSTHKGKPEGVVPPTIHWPDGLPGGVTDEWWAPGCYSSPIYDWPGRSSVIYTTMVLAYHMSGDAHYLQPLFRSAGLRREYIRQHGREAGGWEIGSPEWAASQLGDEIQSPLMKYRMISGDRQFDDLLLEDAGGYANLRLTGDPGLFTTDLKRLSAAFANNEASYTAEVRNTDRVIAFPTNYLSTFYDTVSASSLAGLLYMSLTGDLSHQSHFPMEALSWLCNVGEVASCVLNSNGEKLELQAFNFSSQEQLRLKTRMLHDGRYTLKVAAADGGDPVIRELEIAGTSTEVDIPLPPGKECRVVLSRLPGW